MLKKASAQGLPTDRNPAEHGPPGWPMSVATWLQAKNAARHDGFATRDPPLRPNQWSKPACRRPWPGPVAARLPSRVEASYEI